MSPSSLVLPVTGRCRACGAPIHWATTLRGKHQPLDPEPSGSPDAGNVVLIDGRAHYVTDGERRRLQLVGTAVYTAHFATCPARRRRP